MSTNFKGMLRMAQRPIFVPGLKKGSFVEKLNLNFKWYSGYSITQKQKSIESLHRSAAENNITPILEISTKSSEEIGRKLSAFNLFFEIETGVKISVESAYQGSKVFERGGPYRDFFTLSGKEIKKDKRLYNSGKLIGFDFNGIKWNLEPINLFYDWLYINALIQNPELFYELLKYKGFSDIEFNPQKSVNCQARSAALFVSIYKRNLIDKISKDKNEFLNLMKEIENTPVSFTKLSNKSCTKQLSNDLYSKLNKWRFYTKKVEQLDCSYIIIQEFIQVHPEYKEMEDCVIEKIKLGNSHGWFNYDISKCDVQEFTQYLTKFILSLDDAIKVNENNSYISFKKKKNIACIEVRPSVRKVIVYLKVNPDSVTLLPGFSRDVRQLNHKGTGDLEITIKTKEDLENSKDLIIRSYKSD
ncbi:DUF5655 domain-containing protein [Methanosarcina hadiensis]|uniref:DarT1-associated NADAR antitoxin family protein n=1 Tax=Methanosarcina hadiensis TaxID=3078083 RepID=UPI0039772C9A